MEMRGTGRSCGPAPNASSVSSRFAMLLTYVRNGGGLIGGFGGRRCLAGVIIGNDSLAAPCIRGIHRVRSQKIAWVGDHGGQIVLIGAAEIGSVPVVGGIGKV